jgi:hypothetical protein
MPYLPGSAARQRDILWNLIQAIQASDGLLTISIDVADGSTRTLRDAVKPLSSTGLLNPVDRDHVELSEEASAWLTTGDDAKLLGIFHQHIRFVGEALDSIQSEPATVRALMGVAKEKYDLIWQTPDQVRRRVTWLIALGAIEYRTSTLIAITERGTRMLHGLELGGPPIAKRSPGTSTVIPTPPTAIATVVGQLTQERLAARGSVLGYIPRGSGDSDITEALQALVNAASPTTIKSDLLAFARGRFGISETSFGPTLTTLTRSGLIEQTALNVYRPTQVGQAWLESASSLDLALIMHAHYLFVLEIIPALVEYDRAPDLAQVAVEHYGLPRADTSGVRTRLQLLRAAGLIEERANWRYRATPLGEAIASAYPVQEALPDANENDDESTGVTDAGRSTPTKRARELGRQLIAAGTNSDNPVQLEALTAEAFQFLGFEAQHIGGGGKTDVLATATSLESRAVRIIIDAKAARSGTVNEGAVSFDTLGEHKAQHQADYVALVGPGFDGGRVRARAEKSQVALIDTNELAQILVRHAKTPLSVHEYFGLVSAKETDRQDLEATWLAAERRCTLLARIVAVLAEEARDTDEVTRGALTSDQIYLIVREETPGARPHPDEIAKELDLLGHPLIGSVRVIKGGRAGSDAFHLVDSPELVRDKFAGIARAVGSLVDPPGT